MAVDLKLFLCIAEAIRTSQDIGRFQKPRLFRKCYPFTGLSVELIECEFRRGVVGFVRYCSDNLLKASEKGLLLRPIYKRSDPLLVGCPGGNSFGVSAKAKAFKKHESIRVIEVRPEFSTFVGIGEVSGVVEHQYQFHDAASFWQACKAISDLLNPKS